MASCDPKRTFLKLLHPADLEVDVLTQFQAVRSRGVVGKIHLALEGQPTFAEEDGVQFEKVRLGGDLTDLEKAFDSPKYGDFSPRPYLDIWVPSTADSSLAPQGHHVVSIAVQCVPHKLKRWLDQGEKTRGFGCCSQ